MKIANYKYHRSVKKRHKVVVVAVVLIVIAGLILLFFEKTGKTSLFSQRKYNQTTPSEDRGATTTSNAPTAQSDFAEGDERQPGNSLHENSGSSVIIDTGGNIPANTDTSQPITSSTGEITVYSPTKNTQIRKGQLISGSSTLPKIAYRVIDDVSGMIAMGELTVSSGKFSGTIDFETTSKNGRIDIFATRSDSSEYSTIEIPITFR